MATPLADPDFEVLDADFEVVGDDDFEVMAESKPATTAVAYRPAQSRGDAEMDAARAARKALLPLEQTVAALSRPSSPKPLPSLPAQTQPNAHPRAALLAFSDPAGAPPRRDLPSVESQGLEVNLPGPLKPFNTARGMALGGVKAVLGDSQARRAIEAVQAVDKGLPTFAEAVTSGFGLLDDPLIGRSTAERKRQGQEAIDAVKAKEAGAPAAGLDTFVEPMVKVMPGGVPRFRGRDAVATAEASKAERERDSLTGQGFWGGAAQLAKNTGASIGKTAVGLAEFANEMGGMTLVPKGQTPEEHGEVMGEAMASTVPGAVADTARGIFDPSGANALLTKPIESVLDVLDPGARSLARIPGAARAAALATKPIKAGARFVGEAGSNFIDRRMGLTPDPAIPSAVAEGLAAVKREVGEGATEADPRLTEISEGIVYAGDQPSAKIENLAAQAANIHRARDVQPIRPDLEPTDLSYQPARVVDEAEAAERALARAEVEAGKARDVATATGLASTEAKGVGKDVRAVQRQAGTAERQIAGAAAATPKPSMTPSQRAVAARGAVPGVKLAEATKTLDTAGVESVTKTAASLARTPARKAERLADKAADMADVAGDRPEVNIGTVYEPASGSPGPTLLDEADLLASGSPAVEPFRLAANRAGTLKREAIDAGFADGPVDTAILADAGMPAGTTIYDAARKYADHLHGRNVDNRPNVLAARLERMGVKPAAALPTANWLLAEVDAHNLAEVSHVEYGAISRPAREVQATTATPEGRIPQMAAASVRGMDREIANDPLPEYGPARVDEKEWIALQSRRLEQQPPSPYRTNDPQFDAITEDIAKEARAAGYHPEGGEPGTPGAKTASRMDPDTGRAELSAKDAADPAAWTVRAPNEAGMQVSVPRLQQRMIEFLAPDTAQLLRSKSVKRLALELVKARAERWGLDPAVIQNIVTDFHTRVLRDAGTSTISKNRIEQVNAPDGTPLWTVQDVLDLHKNLTPEKRRAAEADAMLAEGGVIAEAAKAKAQEHAILSEVNRFRLGPDGKTIDRTMGNIEGYALAVAKGVLQDGRALPLAMPYGGAAVASALLNSAGKIASQLGVDPKRITALSDYLATMRPDPALQPVMDGTWRTIFKGAQDPKVYSNVSFKPSLANALKAQLSVQADGAGLNGFAALAHQLGQTAKAGVVARNFRALVNNDLSNLAASSLFWGDPAHMANVLLAPVMAKAHFDGNGAKLLTPADAKMMQGIANTNVVQGAQVSRDIGKTQLFEAVENLFPGLGRQVRRTDAIRGGRYGQGADLAARFQDFQADLYSKLGDIPFRLADVVRAYKNTREYVDALGDGESIAVPVSTTGTRMVQIERLPGDRVRLSQYGGDRAKGTRAGSREVSIDSQELADVLAQYGNVLQEKRNFDYNRTGNVGKALRSGPFSLVSGIFSWFFKALDIPGVKRGLVTEILAGPPILQSTSRKVIDLQFKQRQDLALRRAALHQAAEAAMQTQEGRDDLRRMATYNRTALGAIVAEGSNPYYLETRNVEPQMFGQPTSALLGAAEKLAAWAQFRNVMNDPAELRAMLQPDPAFVATLPPDEQKAVVRRSAALRRYARQEQFSAKQALAMVGMGGGPLLSIMQRMQAAEDGGRPFSAEDGLREFAKQMFGSNLVTMQDVGAAALGEAGVDGAYRWSTYGKAQAKQGFRGGTAAQSDAAGFARWSIRQLLGAGWQTLYYGDGGVENPATGTEFTGRAKTYLADARKALTASMLGPAEQAATIALARHNRELSPLTAAALARARGQYEMVKDVIDTEIDGLSNTLDQQMRALRSEASPVVKPAVRQ